MARLARNSPAKNRHRQPRPHQRPPYPVFVEIQQPVELRLKPALNRCPHEVFIGTSSAGPAELHVRPSVCAGSGVLDPLEKARAEQRNDRHGDDVGGKQRDDNGQGQGREKKFADAVKKRDGEKDDHGGQGRRQHRQADLSAAQPPRATAGNAPISRWR